MQAPNSDQLSRQHKVVEYLTTALNASLAVLDSIDSTHHTGSEHERFEARHEEFVKQVESLYPSAQLCVSTFDSASEVAGDEARRRAIAITVDGVTFSEPPPVEAISLRQWLRRQVASRTGSAISNQVFAWHENCQSSTPVLCLLSYHVPDRNHSCWSEGHTSLPAVPLAAVLTLGAAGPEEPASLSLLA
jgi:hypothetical protein